MKDGQVWIRMGTHAEKEYLLKTLPILEGVIIGANLLEATPWATSSLLVNIAGPTSPVVPYLIDPMTYAFGALADRGVPRDDLDWLKSDRKKGGREFRSSYLGLASEFKGPFERAIKTGKAIVSSDLSSGDRDEMCSGVVDYQLNRIKSVLRSEEDYSDLADNVPPPHSVIAPYFYLNSSRWEADLALNIDMMSRAAKVERSVPLYGVVCADHKMLVQDAFRRRCVNQIKDVGVDGVWLWFSQFAEENVPVEELIGFAMFAREISNMGITVGNLHGGYFSLILSKFGLSAVSHGIGYGEQKNVFPVVGKSVPTVRYYVPDIHVRLGVADIELTFNTLGVLTPADFHEQICGCVICRGVVSNSVEEFRQFGETHYSNPKATRRAQTPAAAKRCRYHFLMTRMTERDSVRKQSVDQIKGQLDDAHTKWHPLPSTMDHTTHLADWKAAIEKLGESEDPSRAE